MAENIVFPGVNKIYEQRLEEDRDDPTRPEMAVFNNGWLNFSAWVLSVEELAEINRTGVVCVAMLLGKHPMPQTYVGSESNIRISTLDMGKPMPSLTTH